MCRLKQFLATFRLSPPFILYWPYLIIIFSLSFQGQLLASEQEKDQRFQTGKELFKSGAYEDAFLIFNELFRESPENQEVNFLLGRAAFEKGDYESALMAFDRILIKNPLDLRAKLEMARCHFRLGSAESAKGLFNDVLATHPPEAVRKHILDYLAYMDQIQKRHWMNGLISLDVLYDNNANSFASNPEINFEILDQITSGSLVTKKEEDVALNLMGQLNHRYAFGDSRYAWKSSGVAYHSLYQEMTDLNLNYLSLGSGPSFHVFTTDIDTRCYYTYIMLDGTSYMDLLGMAVSFSHPIFRHLEAFLMAKWETIDYESPLDEKDGSAIGLNGGLLYSTGKTGITLSFDGEKTEADTDWNTFERIGTSLTIIRELPWDVTLSAIMTYRFTSYYDPDVSYLTFEKGPERGTLEVREDKYFSGTLGVSKTLWRSEKKDASLSCQLMTTFIDSDSTYSLYTYDKHTVSLGAAYGF